MADVTKSVFDVFANIVVHLLAHLGRVVDLILEYFEDISVNIDNSGLLECTRACLALDLLVEVGGGLED